MNLLLRLRDSLPFKRGAQNLVTRDDHLPRALKLANVKRAVDATANLLDVESGLRSVQGVKQHSLLHRSQLELCLEDFLHCGYLSRESRRKTFRFGFSATVKARRSFVVRTTVGASKTIRPARPAPKSARREWNLPRDRRNCRRCRRDLASALRPRFLSALLRQASARRRHRCQRLSSSIFQERRDRFCRSPSPAALREFRMMPAACKQAVVLSKSRATRLLAPARRRLFSAQRKQSIAHFPFHPRKNPRLLRECPRDPTVLIRSLRARRDSRES